MVNTEFEITQHLRLIRGLTWCYKNLKIKAINEPFYNNYFGQISCSFVQDLCTEAENKRLDWRLAHKFWTPVYVELQYHRIKVISHRQVITLSVELVYCMYLHGAVIANIIVKWLLRNVFSAVMESASNSVTVVPNHL